MVARKLATDIARLSRRPNRDVVAAADELAGTARLEHYGRHCGRRHGSPDDSDHRTRCTDRRPALRLSPRGLRSRRIAGVVLPPLGRQQLPCVATVVDGWSMARLADSIGQHGHRLCRDSGGARISAEHDPGSGPASLPYSGDRPLCRNNGGPRGAAGHHDGDVGVPLGPFGARTSARQLTTCPGDGVIRWSISRNGGALLKLPDRIGFLPHLRRRDTMADGKPVERRLAAIVAADVVGYSRLMGADEVGTLRALSAHRRELIDPTIAAHRGRIVKTTGDGLLVEFPSAVEAVACAIVVQRGVALHNETVAEEKRLTWRIGINVGDIISEGDDIFGDGVNVAARLEGLCEPGGLCISRAVRDQVRDKLPVIFDDLGEQQVKNIARPVRAFGLTPQAIIAMPQLAPDRLT